MFERPDVRTRRRRARRPGRPVAAVTVATALVLAACGGSAEDEAAIVAELTARVAELEAEQAESGSQPSEPETDAAPEDTSEDAAEDGAGATEAPAPAPAPEPEPEPEPAPEPEPEPEPAADDPEPDPEPEPEPEPEPDPEVRTTEDEDEEAAEPITLAMESQRRVNSRFIVVVRARSDLGGSDWGIRSVLIERPNEYNALLDHDATWRGPQTGQRDQWSATLNCDRQSKYKDWLFVTATDDEGRTLRTRFDVTVAC